MSTAACAHCHSAVAADQEWCHECGHARTAVSGAPDWRIAAAIVLAVIVVAGAATAFALIRVAHNADRSAAVAFAAAPPRAPSSPAGTSTAKLLNWPAGLGGWTVVLSSSKNQADAKATAASLAPTVSNLGVLNSSEHPSMSPGHWVVFSGRYPTKSEAASAATTLLGQGHANAHPKMVEPPGGN